MSLEFIVNYVLDWFITDADFLAFHSLFRVQIPQGINTTNGINPTCDGRKCTSVRENVPENNLSETITVLKSR